MNLDGTFDYSIVEALFPDLRVLRDRSLVLRKNLLTTKHLESTMGGIQRWMRANPCEER